MSILTVSVYIFQIAVFAYVGAVALQIQRNYTLSKNIDWVLQNKSFKERYCHPNNSPLLFISFIAIALLLWFSQSGSYEQLLWTRISVVLGAVLAISGVYYAIEKSISAKIPLGDTRSASFFPRTIDKYLPGQKSKAIYFIVALIFIIDILWYLLGKIPFETFVGNLVNHTFLYSVCYFSIFYSLKEKLPNREQTKQHISTDIDQKQREFSVRLLIAALYGLVILHLIHLSVQWFGYEMAIPYMKLVYKMLGSDKMVMPFLSVEIGQISDIIISALTIPLFLFLANSRSIKELKNISIFKCS